MWQKLEHMCLFLSEPILHLAIVLSYWYKWTAIPLICDRKSTNLQFFVSFQPYSLKKMRTNNPNGLFFHCWSYNYIDQIWITRNRPPNLQLHQKGPSGPKVILPDRRMDNNFKGILTRGSMPHLNDSNASVHSHSETLKLWLSQWDKWLAISLQKSQDEWRSKFATA